MTLGGNTGSREQRITSKDEKYWINNTGGNMGYRRVYWEQRYEYTVSVQEKIRGKILCISTPSGSLQSTVLSLLLIQIVASSFHSVQLV
jgi:hypothetical protein